MVQLVSETLEQNCPLSVFSTLFDRRQKPLVCSCERHWLLVQEQRRSSLEEKLHVTQVSRGELHTYATQQSGLVV